MKSDEPATCVAKPTCLHRTEEAIELCSSDAEREAWSFWYGHYMTDNTWHLHSFRHSLHLLSSRSGIGECCRMARHCQAIAKELHGHIWEALLL